jgi:hypothetical protein
LALKSAEYRFRFPVIKSVLQRGRTYLSQLSEFPAPPHYVLWLERLPARVGQPPETLVASICDAVDAVVPATASTTAFYSWLHRSSRFWTQAFLGRLARARVAAAIADAQGASESERDAALARAVSPLSRDFGESALEEAADGIFIISEALGAVTRLQGLATEDVTEGQGSGLEPEFEVFPEPAGVQTIRQMVDA